MARASRPARRFFRPYMQTLLTLLIALAAIAFGLVSMIRARNMQYLATQLVAPGLACASAGGRHPPPAVLLRRSLRAAVGDTRLRDRAARASRAGATSTRGCARGSRDADGAAAGPYVLLSRGGVPAGAPRRAGRAVPDGSRRDRDPSASRRRHRGRWPAREARDVPRRSSSTATTRCRSTADGTPRWAFIHGNWALDNSHPHGP